MKLLAAGLYLCAGLLILWALALTGYRAIREHRRLATALNIIDEIAADKSIPESEKTARAEAVLSPRMTCARVPYTLEWIECLILRDALKDLRGPALLTGIGATLGTAASVLSLWA